MGTKHLGECQENHFRLFRERLTREGRIKEYHAAMSALPKNGDSTFPNATEAARVRREFGYVCKEDELERFEDFMLRGIKTQMENEVEQLQKDVKSEQMDQTLDETIPVDIGEYDLPPDIAWVYLHPVMMRPDEDLGPHFKLTLDDMEGAPSRGAIAMLQHYVYNKQKFFETVLRLMAKKDSDPVDQKLEDDGKSIEEIRKMLGEI